MPLVSDPNHWPGLLLFPASEAVRDQESPSLGCFICLESWFSSSGLDASKYFRFKLTSSWAYLGIICPKMPGAGEDCAKSGRGRTGKLSSCWKAGDSGTCAFQRFTQICAEEQLPFF